MNKKLIIASMQIAGNEAVASLLLDENERPVRFFVEPASTRKAPVGSIFVGRIARMDRKTNGSFVQIADGGMVYLPLKDRTPSGRFCMKTNRPAESPLKTGDELLIQIDQEPIKTKRPHARGELNLSGRYLALATGEPSVRFSSRLEPSEKIRIRKMIRRFLQESGGESRYCIIVRTAAGKAGEEDLSSELRTLTERLDHILEKGRHAPCGTCLYRPFFLRYLTDHLDEDGKIETDLPDVYRDLTGPSSVASGGGGFLPDGAECVLYTKEDPLWRRYGMAGLLDRLTAKRIWLKSGATLIVEQTEAFAAIDVNSGKFSRNLDHESMTLRLNLEAAEAAMEQIRLRNLSGTILIDFISMEEEASKETLMKRLRELAGSDFDQTEAIDLTKLGIAEITREKSRPPLSEQIARIRHPEND